MAPWTRATARGGSQSTLPNQPELINRLHSEAPDTPTSLRGGRPGVSSSKTPRVQVDASSSDSDFAPSKPRSHRPQHSRSMSNPFPSLFSGRRRQNSTSKAPVDVDMTDDDNDMAKQGAGTHKRGDPSGSKDFATGNCMTCASLVRWPKELKVFKCTICMTINDLAPVGSDSHGGGGSRRRPETGYGSSSSKQSAPGQVQPLSLEHTKRIVRQCLHSFISKRLHDLSTKAVLEHKPGEDRLHPDLAIRHRGRAEMAQGWRIANNPRTGYQPKYMFKDEPTLNHNLLNTNSSRPSSSSHSERPSLRVAMPTEPLTPHQKNKSIDLADDFKKIFKPLEDYIIDCFHSFECINASFSVHNPRYTAKASGESIRRKQVAPRDVRLPSQVKSTPREVPPTDSSKLVFDLDPKLLLLGDVAENGTWWTGGQDEMVPKRSHPSKDEHTSKPYVMTKFPQLNWGGIREWYSVVNNAAEGWFGIFEELSRDLNLGHPSEQELQVLEQDLIKGQVHTQRALLKATELLLKRPGRPVVDPADLRFLLIILESPQLYPDTDYFRGLLQLETDRPIPPKKVWLTKSIPNYGLLSGQHSGIIKRIVGLISNSPAECHNQMIGWLSRYHPARFLQVKELVSGFLTYRMIRQREKKQGTQIVDVTAGLIPQMQVGRSGAYLHDEIGTSRSVKKSKESPKKFSYADDWQIRAASRVLSLLFAANNLSTTRRGDEAVSGSHSSIARDATCAGRQLLHASDFYNSMIDYTDLVGDFESWESKRSKFSFCQYPFLLSIWAKTKILEYDARRQMQSKARDAFFDSIMTRRNINQYLVFDVRRDCLVDDSLNAVSGVIGSGGEDLKKGLRISFQGEEGIDAGGLRKEWFLLLVREVFNPDHGVFIYDEVSQYCYFNPNSFESSDQFFLVGVVMGLAIYNSTILDVALPPFTFRKLLASAPSSGGAASAHQRPVMKYTLEDLAEYRPQLAHGLRQLLNFEGDVEETFCLDFVVETDKYDSKVQAPLCPGGENKPVTNANRREYVDLYVRYVLDTAVKRQFEPFKRGFYTVCGGNAFSLFRPEEIELLVRGSDEPLDIASLRAVAKYDNWDSRQPDGSEPIVGWFWESFQQATPSDQRSMLLFITGSDRIPAMGAASLVIKISCLGDDCGRFPIARTCFNLLSLWRYETKVKLKAMLWRAVRESEGFGLK